MVFPQPMGQLRQERGFPHAPQAGDDDGMRYGRGPLDLRQAVPLEAGLSFPEGLLLLDQHRGELIRSPLCPPGVFTHIEMIVANVFAVNESFWVIRAHRRRPDPEMLRACLLSIWPLRIRPFL